MVHSFRDPKWQKMPLLPIFKKSVFQRNIFISLKSCHNTKYFKGYGQFPGLSLVHGRSASNIELKRWCLGCSAAAFNWSATTTTVQLSWRKKIRRKNKKLKDGPFYTFLFVLLLVLLSASVERFSFSRLRNLFVYDLKKKKNTENFSYFHKAIFTRYVYLNYSTNKFII